MSTASTPRLNHSGFLASASSPRNDEILRDWLYTETIVSASPSASPFSDLGLQRSCAQSIADLSPVTTLSDLPGVIPEQDQEQYSAMPHSLRRVLTPPQEDDEDASRQRSVLFESTFFPFSSSLPSPQKWPLAPDNSAHSGLSRARQSVSSIASGSTVQTRTVPVKSILTRHDSGISMATTAKARRTKKRSTPSVKFVDAPTVHYERSEYFTPPSSPPCSPTSSSAPKLTSARWWMKWWKKSSGPPPRPTISGPYHLSHTASLVDLHAARNRKPKPGKLKRLWIRLTDAIG